MRRLCCCGGAATVQPAPAKTPDLVADLPPHERLSNDIVLNEEEKSKPEEDEKRIDGNFNIEGTIDDESKGEEVSSNISLTRTPSIQIENISEESLNIENLSAKSIQSDNLAQNIANVENLSDKNVSLGRVEIAVGQPSNQSIKVDSSNDSQQSQVISEIFRSPTPKSASEKSLSLSNQSKSTSKSISSISVRSQPASPEPVSEPVVTRSCERDVRTALTECMIPARHEDWEVIVNALVEAERLAKDEWARAPAASWRAVTRSVAAHVRSLRSRVARAACSTLGALFEYRGRGLDPELEEAVSALLERSADVNRFLRGDATSALGRVVCGGNYARAGVALVRKGTSHRAGPVRAAAAQALTRLIRHHSAVRILDLPIEPRTVILRAAGELIADASPEARTHARHLCLALSEDTRFRQLLKEAMPISRYRAIEKFVDKLRCR